MQSYIFVTLEQMTRNLLKGVDHSVFKTRMSEILLSGTMDDLTSLKIGEVDVAGAEDETVNHNVSIKLINLEQTALRHRQCSCHDARRNGGSDDQNGRW
jgi:hypothetical protein